MADKRSDETMTALEACPFEHDEGRPFPPKVVDGDPVYTVCVECPLCKARGPHISYDGSQDDTDQVKAGAERAAVDEWNKAQRALSARDAQIRREALVEGARWAHEKLATAIAPGASWWFDPAAILERENGGSDGR